MYCTKKSVKSLITMMCVAVLLFSNISMFPAYATVMSQGGIQTYGTGTCATHAYDLQYIGQEGWVQAYKHDVIVGPMQYTCTVRDYKGGYYYRCIYCGDTMGYIQKTIYTTHSVSGCPEA
jgi:hypothetical protein